MQYWVRRDVGRPPPPRRVTLYCAKAQPSHAASRPSRIAIVAAAAEKADVADVAELAQTTDFQAIAGRGVTAAAPDWFVGAGFALRSPFARRR